MHVLQYLIILNFYLSLIFVLLLSCSILAFLLLATAFASFKITINSLDPSLCLRYLSSWTSTKKAFLSKILELVQIRLLCTYSSLKLSKNLNAKVSKNCFLTDFELLKIVLSKWVYSWIIEPVLWILGLTLVFFQLNSLHNWLCFLFRQSSKIKID